MKNILVALLIALAIPLHADLTTTAKADPPKISEEVKADMNKPIEEKKAKIDLGGWICIGVIAIAAILAGSAAWNTRTPL